MLACAVLCSTRLFLVLYGLPCQAVESNRRCKEVLEMALIRCTMSLSYGELTHADQQQCRLEATVNDVSSWAASSGALLIDRLMSSTRQQSRHTKHRQLHAFSPHRLLPVTNISPAPSPLMLMCGRWPKSFLICGQRRPSCVRPMRPMRPPRRFSSVSAWRLCNAMELA